jgi:hypothetical protein
MGSGLAKRSPYGYKCYAANNICWRKRIRNECKKAGCNIRLFICIWVIDLKLPINIYTSYYNSISFLPDYFNTSVIDLPMQPLGI